MSNSEEDLPTEYENGENGLPKIDRRAFNRFLLALPSLVTSSPAASQVHEVVQEIIKDKVLRGQVIELLNLGKAAYASRNILNRIMCTFLSIEKYGSGVRVPNKDDAEAGLELLARRVAKAVVTTEEFEDVANEYPDAFKVYQEINGMIEPSHDYKMKQHYALASKLEKIPFGINDREARVRRYNNFRAIDERAANIRYRRRLRLKDLGMDERFADALSYNSDSEDLDGQVLDAFEGYLSYAGLKPTSELEDSFQEKLITNLKKYSDKVDVESISEIVKEAFDTEASLCKAFHSKDTKISTSSYRPSPWWKPFDDEKVDQAIKKFEEREKEKQANQQLTESQLHGRG